MNALSNLPFYQWSRLIGGSGSSPSKKKKADSPADRLASFKRTCAALQEIWRRGRSDEQADSLAHNHLAQLNDILDDEARAPAPYPCHVYAATSQVYIIVTKLALSSQNAGIISAAARLFNILIDGESEGVLDSQVFARALIDLVRKTSGPGLIPLREEEEGNLIELLFGVANKIRMDPAILPAWFYPDRADSKDDAGEKGAFAGATRKNAFPLFYCLVEYVYHDGRTGDFARTGLLYLTETASRAPRLERWMIESDLATLMASGLGALYSRLSRRLPGVEDNKSLPTVLTLSDYTPPSFNHDTVDFHPNMDAFLSFLLFWQDTLDHCASVEVADTLLDHFHVLFLEQLLYPSLLESSDVDGGSTASVITYLARILESLDHPGMIKRILDYLLAAPHQKSQRSSSPVKRPKMSVSRRKSLDVLTALAKAEDNPSPDFFNLVDLISMSLKSRHEQTVVATLRLLTVIVRRHHSFAFGTLFKVADMPISKPARALHLLNAEIKDLFDMSQSIHINDPEDLDHTYEDLLLDVISMLESHGCSLRKDHPGNSGDEELRFSSPQRVILVRDELLLSHLMMHLERFFSNDTLTNLALTEAIISLTSCSRLVLDDWLLASSDGKDQRHDMAPPVFAMLVKLTDQVKLWKSQTTGWDNMFEELKRKLSEGPGSTSTAAPAKSNGVADSQSRSPSTRGSMDLGAQMLNAYSESVTPRGRNIPQKSSNNTLPAEKSLSPSPAPSASKRAAQLMSPLRRGRGSIATANEDAPTTSPQGPSSLPERLKQQIILDVKSNSSAISNPVDRLRKGSPGVDSSGPSSGTVTPRSEQEDAVATKSVSLSHIMTNAIILQNFLLEIAAVAQTRASLYGEVTFD
ncbi:MAG: hypothetical protein Q9227_004337 [Pyrenula ochraceoflavens]